MSFNNLFKKLISAIDIYGVRVSVNFNNLQIHNTQFGCIVSILIYSTFILFCYSYAAEINEKKKPIVITNEKFVQNPSRMNFDKVQQTVMVGIVNINGKLFNDPKLVQVSSRRQKLQQQFNAQTQSYDRVLVEIPLKMRECDIKDLKIEKIKGYYSKLKLNQLFCFEDDQDVYIEGDYSGDLYSRVDIYINQCVNSTKPDSIVCAPQEKIDDTLQYSYFLAYMVDKFIDPTNLDNPFDYQGFNIVSPTSTKHSKEITAYFQNYYLRTDVGVIQEQIYEQREFVYAGQQETIIFEDPSIITKFVLRPLKNKETIMFRRYMKISDLIAQLGGLMKLLVIIGHLITFPFVRFHLNKEIINTVFDFDFSEPSNKENQSRQIDIQLSHQENQPLKEFKMKEQRMDYLKSNLQSPNQTLQSEQKQSRNIPIQLEDFKLNQILTKDNTPYTLQNSNNSILKKEDNLSKQQNEAAENQNIAFQNINSKQDKNDQFYKVEFQMMEKIKNIMNPIRKRIKFTSCQYLCQIFSSFFCKLSGKQSMIQESINLVQHHLDIQYILSKFQEIDKLKQIVLSDDQIKLFEILPRPVIGKLTEQGRLDINNKFFQKQKTQEEMVDDAYNSLLNILNKEKKSQRDLKLVELLDYKIFNAFSKVMQQPYKLSFVQQQYCSQLIKRLSSIDNDMIIEQQLANVATDLKISNTYSFQNQEELHFQNQKLERKQSYSSNYENCEGTINKQPLSFFMKYNTNSLSSQQ